jgi:hypothetical protein
VLGYYSVVSGSVELAIPGSISFPSCVSSRNAQNVDISTGQISVADTKMSSAGYYVTVSVSNLSSGGNSISSSNVSGNVAGASVSLVSGTANASVTVPTGAGSVGSGYVALGSSKTILQRSGGGGVSGTYAVNLAMRVNVPGYSPTGTYSGIVTFTLIEN